MKRRLVTLISMLAVLLGLLPVSGQAAGSQTNFKKVRTYAAGQFTDVSDQWYAPYVQAGYEYGLINGKTATAYEPSNSLTIGEAVKLAACLHSIYHTGKADFPEATPWYQPYAAYALKNGIIKIPYADYNATAKRSDFAVIFAKALPDAALTAINKVDDNAIPDVPAGAACAPAVYTLYRAGILTGSDSAGTFYPSSSITRDAVAAIAARMADTSLRQRFTLPAVSPAVYAGYAPVPDCGAFTGTALYQKLSFSDGAASFYYRISDASGADVDGYSQLLEKHGFRYITGFDADDGYSISVYSNDVWYVYTGKSDLDGTVCYRVMITSVSNIT